MWMTFSGLVIPLLNRTCDRVKLSSAAINDKSSAFALPFSGAELKDILIVPSANCFVKRQTRCLVVTLTR